MQKQGKWIVAAVAAWALMLAGSIGLLGMAFNWWGGEPSASASDLSALRDQPSRTATTDPSVEPSTLTPTPTTATPRPTPTPTSTPTRPPAPKPEETTRPPAPKPTTKKPEPKPEPEPTRAPQPRPQPPTSQEAAYENEVVQYTNAARREAGCGPVRVDDRLRTAARKHSYDMAARHYFSHTSQDGRSPWDRMRASGYTTPAAENIARGQSDARRVMASWLMSEGHRNNILNCRIRAIGVGVRLGGDGPYWTQDFGYK